MIIANLSLIFITASNLLSSPFLMRSASSKIQQITFLRSTLNRFSSNFYYSSTSFNNIYKSHKFEFVSFSNFIDTPIKLEETHITNFTYTSQKAISVYSDVFISYCTFKNCQSKTNSGGALFVSTPSSKVEDSSIIKFQLKFSTFYNCSALSSGAIYVQFAGDITINSICFNNCESTISNQAGFIDVIVEQPIESHIDIKYISFFRCPGKESSLSSGKGMKNCFQIKSEKISFAIKYLNSSFNDNNNDKGCVLTLTGLTDVEISYPIIINNTGSDAFSMLRVASLALIDGLFAYNYFYVAPFNSYGYINVEQPYQIFLYSIDYLYNDVYQEKGVTGTITVYAAKCQIDPPDSPFGYGVLLTINNPRNGVRSPVDLNAKFFPDSCFYVKQPATSPVSKSIKNSADFIVYCIFGACGFIIIALTTVLIVYCVIKKNKLRKWIEENESSKQNTSICSTSFVDNLAE